MRLLYDVFYEASRSIGADTVTEVLNETVSLRDGHAERLQALNESQTISEMSVSGAITSTKGKLYR